MQLACELVAWTQMLAFTGHAARCREPKRLRLRLWSIAGRITRHARRTVVNLAARAPSVKVLIAALDRLVALPTPA